MNKKQAEEKAAELGDKKRGVYAKVGSHTTNGVKRFVVHVTHKETIHPPFTVSSP